MTKVNVAEVKAKFSEYLALVAGGERVVICKHNRPVAELVAVETVRTEPRPVDGASGLFTVPPGFFDPLPEDLVSGFTGAGDDLPARVEETGQAYGSVPKTRTRR